MKAAIVLGLLLAGTPALAQWPTTSEMRTEHRRETESHRHKDTRKPMTAFYQGQYVDGMSRICIYNDMGSKYILTVGITDLCPI